MSIFHNFSKTIKHNFSKLSASLIIFSGCIFSSQAFANITDDATNAIDSLKGDILNEIEGSSIILGAFDKIANFLDFILFHNILGVPFLVLWLIAAGLFMTFRLGFPNITFFKHGFQSAFGKYSRPDDRGEVSPLQAFLATLSSVVGLGNVAGVAIAVSYGGPGAIIWMMIMAFFGMSVVFGEAILSQKYRRFDDEDRVLGGPFQYLEYGLADLNMKKLGVVLAMVFSFLCLFSNVGSAIFQTHESTSIFIDIFPSLQNIPWVVSLAMAILTGLVLIGGIKRLVHVTEILVPLMSLIYVLGCIIILLFNFTNIPHVIWIMISDAFAVKSVAGGIIGTIVMGIRRSIFSNEAGLGTNSIVGAVAKSREPVRQASVIALIPFFDTVIICFMTGIAITVTGVYADPSIGDGIKITDAAFRSVAGWFPSVLMVAVLLFAYSTVITLGYYTEQAWEKLLGEKKHIKIFKRRFNSVNLIHLVYCFFIFTAGMISFETVVRLADSLVLVMAIPNMIGVYLLSNIIAKETKSYLKRWKDGEFDKQ